MAIRRGEGENGDNGGGGGGLALSLPPRPDLRTPIPFSEAGDRGDQPKQFRKPQEVEDPRNRMGPIVAPVIPEPVEVGRMFRDNGGRPGDERGFLGSLIKKIGFGLGGPEGVIAIGERLGGPLGEAARLGRQLLPRPTGQPIATTVIPTTFAPTGTTTGIPGFPTGIPGAGFAGGNGAGPCRPPLVRDPMGRGFCVAPTSPLGAEVLGGRATQGRFGPAEVPGSVLRDIATCSRGMVLGKDGLCYDRLPNRDRLYPRGRRPLLTGGDMRAISRAAAAGRKMARVRSDLTGIGLLKPPPKRRRKKA